MARNRSIDAWVDKMVELTMRDTVTTTDKPDKFQLRREAEIQVMQNMLRRNTNPMLAARVMRARRNLIRCGKI